MAHNEIPRDYDGIVQHLEDAGDGAHAHATAIGLLQNTETKVRADATALAGTPAAGGNPAVPGLKADWNTAKANKTAQTAALRTVESNGRSLLMTCLGTLKSVFGQKWNSQWNAVGFTDNSLEVPDHPLVKLQQLRAFYAANPAREVANVNGTACTAVACEAAAQAISDAQTVSHQSNVDAGKAKAALEAGLAAGRNRLSGLRDELNQLLADDDPRWLAFGFELPGKSRAPDVPQHLVATPGAAGSHSIFYDWDNARRADNYRIVIKDADGNVLVNELVNESEYMADDLPVGTTVTATVTGHNATGESQSSAAVNTSVP